MKTVPGLWSLGALAALALSSAAAAQPAKIPMNNPAVAFLDTAFNQHKVAEAFERYVGPTYKQHNPTVPDGKEQAIKLLSGVPPTLKYDIKRVLVDKDLVAIHSNLTFKPGDRGMAVVDIFRLEKGKIVEHWDVLQAVPEKAANENTMF